MAKEFLKWILPKVCDAFVSRRVEDAAVNANNSINNIRDFNFNIESLQQNFESLSAAASDVKEQIKNAEYSGRKKRKRQVEKWLEKVESIEEEIVELGFGGLLARLSDGGKAVQLNDDIDKLIQERQSFGELMLDCGTKGAILLTNEMVGEAFEENLERISKILENRQVSRIGILGMGGVGKTTLTKHINNILLQKYEGHVRVIWVTVTHEFSIKSLQGKIARFLGVDLLDEDEEGIRASILSEVLSKTDSVLIFDDVWDDIDMSEVGCPISLECCRLIITTRSSYVCRQIDCGEVIFVEKLSEDEGWKLFNKILDSKKELGHQVGKIAKSIAKLCGGLPLGIKALAGSMRGVTTIRAWEIAFAELKRCLAGKDGMEEMKIFEVLKYSFDRLNRNRQSESDEYNESQLGFLCCSLYPEDYEIPIEDLARKFISEGLVDQIESRRRAQVEQGHHILNILVNVCLLESCVNEDDEECVKMHDLVRGMALQISRGKYMVRAGDESLTEIPVQKNWAKGLEKVSLMKSGIRRIRDGTSPDCPKLSTLILCGTPLKIIPHSFFLKMQGLRTLDLCETDIKMLPDSICNMKVLKSLLLENCYKLEKVPYLGKLKALRELNLSGTAIKQVPRGLDLLLDLEFLSMDANMLNILPRQLFLKLGHLQHVSVPFHIQVSTEEIENLNQLEEFHGGVKNVEDFNWFITSRGHTCYRIGVSSHSTDHGRVGGSLICSNNELMLSECNLQDEKVLGQGIVFLTIRKCEGLSRCFVDDFSQLDNPTSLKKLRIESCGGTECILSSQQGSQILSLEDIELAELENLKRVIEKRDIGTSVAPAVDVFSSLRRLVIYNCSKMREMGFPASGVPNIEEITVERCREIKKIFEEGSVSLPKLKGMTLYDLPILERICDATMICKSIQTISIKKCPRLMKKLPVHLPDPPPPTLRKIEVEREWWDSLEWDNHNLPRLPHPFLHLL